MFLFYCYQDIQQLVINGTNIWWIDDVNFCRDLPSASDEKKLNLYVKVSYNNKVSGHL